MGRKGFQVITAWTVGLLPLQNYTPFLRIPYSTNVGLDPASFSTGDKDYAEAHGTSQVMGTVVVR